MTHHVSRVAQQQSEQVPDGRFQFSGSEAQRVINESTDI